MYYVKTMADNSGYANHRVICLVVIGSSFDCMSSKKYNFSIIMIGIEMKLNIPVHYQMGNFQKY
jgi:hypothetical protein